jgi:hypothetical protein
MVPRILLIFLIATKVSDAHQHQGMNLQPSAWGCCKIPHSDSLPFITFSLIQSGRQRIDPSFVIRLLGLKQGDLRGGNDDEEPAISPPSPACSSPLFSDDEVEDAPAAPSPPPPPPIPITVRARFWPEAIRMAPLLLSQPVHATRTRRHNAIGYDRVFWPSLCASIARVLTFTQIERVYARTLPLFHTLSHKHARAHAAHTHTRSDTCIQTHPKLRAQTPVRAHTDMRITQKRVRTC